jgi:putative flippase GtrA
VVYDLAPTADRDCGTTFDSMIIRLWSNSQKFRFLILGAWNTLFGYGAFALGYILLNRWLQYFVIALLAHAVAVTQSFLTHKFFVFKSSGPWPAEFLRFNLTHLSTFVAGLAGLVLLVDTFGLHPLVAQAFVLVATVVVAYLAHARFSFKRHRSPASTAREKTK